MRGSSADGAGGLSRVPSLFANCKNERCCVDHFTERSQTAKSADPWTLNSLARRPPAAPPTCSLRLGDRAARLASLLVATVFERFGGSRPGAFGNTSHPVRRASVTDWSSTVHRRLLAVFALWPTLDEAPMRKLFCATAPVVLLCALPVNAQQQPPAGPSLWRSLSHMSNLAWRATSVLSRRRRRNRRLLPKRSPFLGPAELPDCRKQGSVGTALAKGQIRALRKNNVRSGHDFVHLCDGPDRPGSEQRSILWTGSAGLREALRYILRRHRDCHSYDDLGVPTLLHQDPPLLPSRQRRCLAPGNLFGEPNPRHSLG